ncbi:MAG: DUF2791 family P-loop domain-containing protein [Desulfamplus sp.]|nr:DUF2791 family P-loop domain-containing protein [Desulfamplus sp.]
MQNNHDFEYILSKTPNFKLRQAVERLREGLFDPLGVRLLTTGEITLNHHFENQIENLQKGKPAHFCVCGAYGQGKSHTLNYIRQRSLEEKYVVSTINLDPREVPFHNLKQVYRSIMENLTFPDNTTVATTENEDMTNSNSDNTEFADIWKRSSRNWLSLPENRGKTIIDMIPETIPHRFKAILTAMAQQTIKIPNGKLNLKQKSRVISNLKKYAGFQPREFPWILLNAFMGKDIPVTLLRNALKYRQVSFYNDESLACRDPRLYLEAIKGYASLFQDMGYKGFIVLFDEAESIMIATIRNRTKSYSILHDIFSPQKAPKGFFPVFAFTDDFFTHLNDEDFEQKKSIVKKRYPSLTNQSPTDDALNILNLNKVQDSSESHEEVHIFEKDYSKAWRNINIYKLRNLNSKEWHDIIVKLINIHSLAYNWHPDVALMDKTIFSKLLKQSDAESRMKLKLIVNILDIEQQKILISKYS